MTRSTAMVFVRTVQVLPLVTIVTNVYHCTMNIWCLLTIQTDAKVSFRFLILFKVNPSLISFIGVCRAELKTEDHVGCSPVSICKM